MFDRWNQQRIADGLDPWDPQTVYHPRGVPDDEIDIFIDTSSVAPRCARPCSNIAPNGEI